MIICPQCEKRASPTISTLAAIDAVLCPKLSSLPRLLAAPIATSTSIEAFTHARKYGVSGTNTQPNICVCVWIVMCLTVFVLQPVLIEVELTFSSSAKSDVCCTPTALRLCSIFCHKMSQNSKDSMSSQRLVHATGLRRRKKKSLDGC